MSAASTREGPFQHLRIDLWSPDQLQVFIRNLRRNPHLVAVENSTEEQFYASRSKSV